MSNTTNSTSDLLGPLKEEWNSIDFQWVALESLSDILCVSMALYVGLAGLRKLWPYHEGYSGTRKGFVWLAARWGVGNYPHLFRTLIGLIEVSVFLGCMVCFLPGPTAQLITCLSLVAGMAVCCAYFVTHWSDSWKQKFSVLGQFAQAGAALAIRLYQDFDWTDRQHVLVLYGFVGITSIAFLYMVYRRLRFGHVPDPLLG